MCDYDKTLLLRLKRNRQWRQIVDLYQSGKSSFVIAKTLLLPPEEAAVLCLIIEKLILKENKNDE